MGKPSPHGALGIDGGAPAPEPPPLELPPPEPPLDAELFVPLPVVVSAMHQCRCNTSGPECRSDLWRFRAFGRPPETSPTTTQ